jgi:nucleotide-binding universal stress UspA family protein
MRDLRRILVPIDFSGASGDAAAWAAGLAPVTGGELHLLHVLPPPEFGFAMVEPGPSRLRELSAERREQARIALSRLCPELEEGIVLCPQVTEGEPAAEIIRYAGRHDMDAVVMPTHGKGRLERLLLIGSVTIKVLHALERPVITGAHFEHDRPPRKVSRVLCAVDLGPASERVLCAALQFAAKFGARLSIAHAAGLFGHAAEGVYDRSWRDTVVSRVHQRLDRLKQELHVEADTWVELDQPPRAISSLALKLGADLVVLGRGASDSLIGRLRAEAYDIIRLCHCPVVSV